MQDTFTIKPINGMHAEQALSLVSTEFSAGSPLHRSMGITQQEYREYLSIGWNSYILDGPVDTLGAFSNANNELIGCVIATSFPACFDNTEKLPEKHKPIAALLQSLELQYLQTTGCSDNALLVDLAVVRTDYRESGIYQRLRTAIQQNAKSSDYNFVLGELSSAATQHVCIDRLKHQVVAEISYKEFNYKGGTPFSSIDNPRSIQLVSTAV